MKRYFSFVGFLTSLLACNSNFDKTSNNIDIVKRNQLIEKYDLLNFQPFSEKRIFVSLEEFFEGNNDIASIAPNLTEKPPLTDFFSKFLEIRKDERVTDVLVEIKDIIIYENGNLGDSDWPFTDNIYIIGDVDISFVKNKTKELFPDEVEYDSENYLTTMNEKYANKKIIYVWWD